MTRNRVAHRASVLAAVLALLSQVASAQDHDAQPGKIRILSSRGATFEPSAGDVGARRKAEAEAARAAAPTSRSAPTPVAPPQRRSVPPVPKAELSPFMQAQQQGTQGSQRPSVRQTDRSSAPMAARAATPQAAEDQRRREEAARREAKLASVRLGSTSPMNVGVPRASGGTARPTLPASNQQRGAAVASSATAATAVVAAVEPPLPPTAPVPGRNPSLSASDPLLAEVVRDGSDYYFTGKINGHSARFRIREQISGIEIPVRLAVDLKVVVSVPKGLPANAEWVTPVQSLFFGANPVHAVMARIVPTGDAIDVGADALAAFRITPSNGRNFLVLGARPPAAAM